MSQVYFRLHKNINPKELWLHFVQGYHSKDFRTDRARVTKETTITFAERQIGANSKTPPRFTRARSEHVLFYPTRKRSTDGRDLFHAFARIRRNRPVERGIRQGLSHGSLEDPFRPAPE